ncbi:phage tail family protein [Sporosarcina sp. E16_8]|uniref:phage tail family protein n=1 Tax=Sporosarcina sp. E16_8 TaxID=2789295 RepID=UPI001A921D48|nr:phage tail family protein [Sporosarcina sp. E16_8]MBO0586113.1 phage tail family protein [Sporosarcina sp. E16_8]
MIKFTNKRGESIIFNQIGSPFGLNNFNGLGDVEADVQMSKSPFQDGSTYIDSLLSTRAINFDVTIFGTDDTDISRKRSQLSSVFNPKLGVGLLEYHYGDVVREIYAVPEHVPVFGAGFENRGRRHQKALIDLICPSPFWQDINPTIIKLQDFVGNFFFPISFPASFSIRGDVENLLNAGDVSTPINVTFRGESVNPVITKVATGEFIRINRTIPAEHSLIITTGFNEKSVKIIDPYGVESNAMGYIDLDSTFMSLDVGENKLSFITDGGSPEVFIEYRNLYLSV